MNNGTSDILSRERGFRHERPNALHSKERPRNKLICRPARLSGSPPRLGRTGVHRWAVQGHGVSAAATTPPLFAYGSQIGGGDLHRRVDKAVWTAGWRFGVSTPWTTANGGTTDGPGGNASWTSDSSIPDARRASLGRAAQFCICTSLSSNVKGADDGQGPETIQPRTTETQATPT